MVTNNKYNKTNLSSMKRRNFWIAAGPFFETNLVLIPALDPQVFNADGQDRQFKAEIVLYDADGGVVNEISLDLPSDKPSTIELEPFMEACKYEEGMKHAGLCVSSQAPFSSFCRIFARQSSAVLGELLDLNSLNKIFLPVSLSGDKQTFVALVNYSNETALVKTKLFFAKRSPETTTSLPPRGCRLVNLESEFGDQIESLADKQLPGYVRISTKSDGEIGVQLFEKVEGHKDISIFTTVSGAML